MSTAATIMPCGIVCAVACARVHCCIALRQTASGPSARSLVDLRVAGRRRVLRLGLEQYRGLGGRISGVAGDRSCDDGTHLDFSTGLRLVDVRGRGFALC